MQDRRVVVTGVGVISSIGIGKDEFWKNALLGKNGITPITTFSTEGLPNKYGGEVHDFNAKDFVKKENLKRFGRASRLAVASAKLALKDAKLESSKKTDYAVLVGTTMGESQVIEAIDEKWVKDGEKNIEKDLVAQYPSNALAVNVAFELGLEGPSMVIPTACAAGNYAIGYGYDLIKTGQASIAIAGGADSFSRIAYTGFTRMIAMSPFKCSPFDKNRKGMMVGEGSGFLILESLDSAIKRNARIYAEILGYGLSCDASHMTIQSQKGIEAVMQKALKNSGIPLENVDYICAHGTGTQMNDKTEAQAIKSVFGDRTKDIAVNSIKSILGHTMGAASAIEAVCCSLAVADSKIPPTINFETPDPDCPIDCVPNVAKSKQIRIALNNSFAFGGNNASVVFSMFKGGS